MDVIKKNRVKRLNFLLFFFWVSWLFKLLNYNKYQSLIRFKTIIIIKKINKKKMMSIYKIIKNNLFIYLYFILNLHLIYLKSNEIQKYYWSHQIVFIIIVFFSIWDINYYSNEWTHLLFYLILIQILFKFFLFLLLFFFYF